MKRALWLGEATLAVFAVCLIGAVAAPLVGLAIVLVTIATGIAWGTNKAEDFCRDILNDVRSRAPR